MGKRSKRLKKLRRQAALAIQGFVKETKMHDVGYRSNFIKDCHKGMIRVFDYRKARIYAGARTDAFYGPEGYDLHIDLAGESIYNGPKVKVNGLARAIVGPNLFARQDYARITVEWTDFSIPYFLEVEDWLELVHAIGNIDGKIAIYCVGGHGRTGTALAILASLCGAVPEDMCPVEWVRHVYCEEAVESRSQLDYIEKMTGVDVTARPRGYTGGKKWWEKGGDYVGDAYDRGDSRGPYESTPSPGATTATILTGMPPASQGIDGVYSTASGNIIPAKGLYRGEIAGYDWDGHSHMYRPKKLNGHAVEIVGQDETEYATPNVNAAGDVVSWDYTKAQTPAEDIPVSLGERPWEHWS